MTPDSNDRVARAISGIAPPFPAVGAVPLHSMLEEQNLLQAEIPSLTKAGVFDWLMAAGHAPPDLGEDEELAGFLYVAGPVGVVFVNASDSIARRRFTVAHEIGHFLLHRALMTNGRWIADSPQMIHEVDEETSWLHEREANRFAAELLMPECVCRTRIDAFRRQFPAASRPLLVHRLSADLLVSREALTYRLKPMEDIHDSSR